MQTSTSTITIQGYKIEPSNADLIEEIDQNTLIQLRHMFQYGQFIIGDMAVKYIERNAESKAGYTHERMFEAIGAFCGKGARTVQYYYETAAFYPVAVRQEYEELPFSAFVAAKVYGDGYRGFLDFAMLRPGVAVKTLAWLWRREILSRGGVASSVSESEEEDLERSEIPIPPGNSPKSGAEERREVSQAYHGPSDYDAERVESHSRLAVTNGALHVLKNLRELAAGAKMREDSQNLILDAIDTLIRLLPELARNLI